MMSLVRLFNRFVVSTARLFDFVLFTSVLLLFGHLRFRRQIKSIWPKQPVTLGPKIVLFMHFDKYGNVRPQIVQYIKELAESGRSVVFITNSGKLRSKAKAVLEPICTSIIIRNNVGYDFGAWRDGIAHYNLPQPHTEELIIANDSVFGPLRPINAMLGAIDYNKADMWGLTESWQHRYHLQSYFLAFGKKALNDRAFRKFWAKVRPVPSKRYIVKHYEIGITQYMLKYGLTCAAVWPYDTLISMIDQLQINKLLTFKKNDYRKVDPVSITRKMHLLRVRHAMARRGPLNPSAELWRQLLQSGFPFLKRELLRDNPTKVEDVHDWIHTVQHELGLDPEPTLVELRMMLKGIAP
ncbi:MAG TPA: rhamnan synthesis F family protein [Acidocella sp.]|nr:rhamnan synthesis F family protein [Acidocella sp.]